MFFNDSIVVVIYSAEEPSERFEVALMLLQLELLESLEELSEVDPACCLVDLLLLDLFPC